MDTINHRKIGIALVVVAFILLCILIIMKVNADEQGELLCSFVENSPSLTMEQCPAHTNPLSWYVLGAVVLAMLILASGVYLYFLPVRKEHTTPAGNLKELAGEEAMIYELIKTSEGMMYQSDIIKQTGITKVKVSRILDKLEGRSLLERKRRVMTNVVILK